MRRAGTPGRLRSLMDKEFTRQKIKELRAMVAETDRIAIVLQDDPDPDAMASAMALARAARTQQADHAHFQPSLR